MLRINYDAVGSAESASNANNETVLFAKEGYYPTLHSNPFFGYYIGEDELIYRIIPNGNSRAVYVEGGLAEIEMQKLVKELGQIPVKRMVLKLLDKPSYSNDFLWKNLQTITGVIDRSEESEDLIRKILSEENSDARKALQHVKLGYKETDWGFLLTDWGYYGAMSSKGCIELIRTEDGQEYLTCPE